MSARRALLVGVVLLFAPVPLDAQKAAERKRTPVADHPRVQQALDLAAGWLEGQSAYEQIPGVSGAIVFDQDVIWSGGFGYADLERKTPATSSTVYSICSISKLFTSVALMRLRDEGKLRLDDPVSRHLPWFTIKRTYPDAPEITVEGLLTHASGLPRESDYPYWTGEFQFPTHEQIVQRIARQETLYPASQYFQYSNLGLTLAGEIVAAQAGQPYGDYVRRTILQPLGLASTTPEMPEELKGGRLATGYTALRRDGTRAPVPFFQTRGIAPAAGYASTAEDLARFAAWQLRLLQKGGEEVLKANTLREMQRVHWVDPDWQTTWGLGFAVTRDGEKTFVGHGGSCPGYRTQLMLAPTDQVATVFMANALGVNSGAYARQMYEIVAPAIAAAKADSVKAPAKPDASLLKYAGTYSEQPWDGESLIVPWEDGLAAVSLPSSQPMRDLTKLKRAAGEHTFRRVRKDGSLGEVVRFEMGPDGHAVAQWWHSNRYPRIDVARKLAGSTERK